MQWLMGHKYTSTDLDGQNSYMQGILPDGIRPTQSEAKLCRLIAAPRIPPGIQLTQK